MMMIEKIRQEEADRITKEAARASKTDHERKAMEIASTAVYSILRDWIKGQVTAIETGILTFEGAFLGQLLLPSGKTVLEHAQTSQLLLAKNA